MSYSLQTQCWNCQKASECTDAEKIQAAINGIHESEHKGAGSVIIQCVRMVEKQEP